MKSFYRLGPLVVVAMAAMAGEASIANILDSFGGAMPEIGRKARVAVVAVDLPYTEPNIETVDVTGQILDWLQADKATRNIVRELERQPV